MSDLEKYIEKRISHYNAPYLAAFEVPIYQAVQQELRELLEKIRSGKFQRGLFE